MSKNIIRNVRNMIIDVLCSWNQTAYLLSVEKPLDPEEFKTNVELNLKIVDVEFRAYINTHLLTTPEDVDRAAEMLEFAICRARSN